MNRQPRYQPGQKIGGRFLVHQALMGGMGEVYLCLDEQEMVPLALKTFQGSSPRLRAIFQEEVSKWVTLEKHPNVVRCFWMQTLDNVPFMGLEWVASDDSRGTDLRSWLRHGPLDLALALRFTIDICRGLEHAGEKVPGIVHRDLKPDNVLVNQSRQAKITDFGLATVAQRAGLDLEAAPDDGDALQQSRYVGNVVGTPPYMAPEQWRGEAVFDARTDMYAVGCIFYELLTGRWVYPGPTLSQLQQQHLHAPIPLPNGDLPPDIGHILKGCLAKRCEDRFEGVRQLLAELKRVYEVHTGAALPELDAGEFTASDYGNRGVTYANLGQYERARADFTQALRLNPADAMAYSNRGNTYYEQARYEEALADFTQALRLNPAYAGAYSNRGNTYDSLGRYEEALADHAQAIRLNPTEAIVYFNRGSTYASLGRYEEALADFTQAIRLNPTYASAYSNRGSTHTSLGHDEEAFTDFTQAIRLDPTEATYYSNRGSAYHKRARYEEAFTDFTQALRLNPAHADAYYNRGSTYASLGRHEEALADFAQAIRLDPADTTAYYDRGTTYASLGRYEEALADFAQAIRLNPADASAYANRGNTYASLGQYEEALADFAEALRLNPAKAIVYSNRGLTYYHLKRYEEALADYTEALRLDPADADAYFNRGVLYANTNRLRESLPDFEKAYALGFQQALGAIQQVRRKLDLPLVRPAADDPQAAFVAFPLAESLEGMRQVVQQYPILTQMIPAIEQTIAQQVPPEYRPAFEQRLAWLKQIAKEDSP